MQKSYMNICWRSIIFSSHLSLNFEMFSKMNVSTRWSTRWLYRMSYIKQKVTNARKTIHNASLYLAINRTYQKHTLYYVKMYEWIEYVKINLNWPCFHFLLSMSTKRALKYALKYSCVFFVCMRVEIVKQNNGFSAFK